MDLQTLENQRLVAYREYKRLVIIGACLAIILIGLIILAVASSKRRKFQNSIKPILVRGLLEEDYPEGAVYEPNIGIPLEDIMRVGMFKRPDRYDMEDLIEGKFNGVYFKACDLHLEEKHEHYNPQTKRTETTWVTYFRGRWYNFKFERNLDMIIKIKEKKLLDDMYVKGLEKCELESIDFSDKFKVFASDAQGLFYIMTPSMIEKFISLEKMHRGKCMFAFIGNEFFMGINDGKDYLETNIKKAITEEALKEYRSQIDIYGAIISELKLDSDKFKNQN